MINWSMSFEKELHILGRFNSNIVDDIGCVYLSLMFNVASIPLLIIIHVRTSIVHVLFLHLKIPYITNEN